MSEQQHGVVFPTGPDGRRSTAALGRAVIAEALRPVDPLGARAAERETNWRTGYLPHLRRTIEAGVGARADALAIAAAGLTALHHRMRVVPAGPGGGAEVPLATLADAPAGRALGTEVVTGSAEPEREFTLPYRGRRLRGAELAARLIDWVDRGIVEPGCAAAVREVVAHPEWLALPGRTVTVLGAGAEMGPLTALLRWGATVAAVDLPRPQLWDRVLDTARRGAGTLLVPTGDGGRGADLIGEVPAVADWVSGLDGVPVLGNYVYADGATNVRVSVAVDALTLRVQRQRPDLALAFLATPTDVFVVPEEAVAASQAAHAGRGRAATLLGRPLRTVSGGRLLQRAYAREATGPGIADSLVPQQGPNYALAKRLQRWRATTARAAGTTVSMNVAPPTRTRSVLKNRALAAAYAGAHRFGVEVFDPATSNVLMAALLVHDLHTGQDPADEPWRDEARRAAHGGLWRTAYAPRSALGLAAVLGLGAARS